MVLGKGYIVRGPNNFNNTPQDFTAEFQNGKPNNGIITIPISRGAFTGSDYSGTNSATITRFDDNWNLVGNPYPSAISVLDFLNEVGFEVVGICVDNHSVNRNLF